MWDPSLLSGPVAQDIARTLGDPAIAWLAWAIPAAVSAITSLWSGHKQSDAAKEAAKIQVQGTKDAQAYIDKGYQQGQTALSPWLTTGGVAATTLGGLMGLPTAPASSAPPMTPTTPSVTAQNPLSAWTSTTPEQAYTTSPYARRLAKNYSPETGGVDPAEMGYFAPTPEQKNATGYAMMKSPTGEYSYVHPSQIQHFQQLGATVVE